ncbi:MAG: calcium/proton exchanger [Chloroflexi bacterium]|nr:calcium/proton exchanger [Chloroflexota bacterium]
MRELKESSILDKVLYAFFLFVPLAFVARFLEFAPLYTFFIAALAVVPIAKLMGEATEALAHHAGPGIGGLLNATFGNAVELIISMIALTKGLPEVVKASITGSIIGNILFVLGLSMFLGGLSRKHQLFNRVGASASASQMSLAAIALIVPAIFTATLGTNLTTQKQDDLLENLSLVVAGILLLCYVAQLIFFLRTHSDLTAEESGSEEERKFGQALAKAEQQLLQEEETEEVSTWGVRRAVITLLIATVVVGFVSEILVGSIEPLTKELGWTELFVGVILVAVIGNAAEHMTAVTVAMKNKMNLAMNIAIGSSLQIAFFVAPVLVFFGFFFGHPLNLRFEEFELVSIVASILIVNLVSSDGESNWFEGLQLLAAYLIIAVAFFLHP